MTGPVWGPVGADRGNGLRESQGLGFGGRRSLPPPPPGVHVGAALQARLGRGVAEEDKERAKFIAPEPVPEEVLLRRGLGVGPGPGLAADALAAPPAPPVTRPSVPPGGDEG